MRVPFIPDPLGLLNKSNARMMKMPVDEEEAKEEAYEMGYQEGLKTGDIARTIPEVDSPDEAYRNMQEGFVQSARYANHILPELRSLAGYRDAGYGTHTDAPDEDAMWLYDELVDEFWEGVYEGIVDGWRD